MKIDHPISGGHQTLGLTTNAGASASAAAGDSFAPQANLRANSPSGSAAVAMVAPGSGVIIVTVTTYQVVAFNRPIKFVTNLCGSHWSFGEPTTFASEDDAAKAATKARLLSFRIVPVQPEEVA